MSEVNFNSKVEVVTIDSGIQEASVIKNVQDLSVALASTYSLYLKTQGFHWNTVGPLFFSLHKMSEEHYEELAEAVDNLAERIRALGHIAPATFAQFINLSFIKEDTQILTTHRALQALIYDHEKIATFMRQASQRAQESHDEATADLYATRIAHHEKIAWILRAILS